MAATRLWHIKGNLKDLLDYVENPEKTVPDKDMQDFFDVFSYCEIQRKQVAAVMFLQSTVWRKPPCSR